MINVSVLHTMESELRERLEKLNPEHPALKIIYSSKLAAISAYEMALGLLASHNGEQVRKELYEKVIAGC